MRLPDDSADETDCRPEGEATSGEGKPRSVMLCRGGKEMYEGFESPAKDGRDGAGGDWAGLDAGRDPWADDVVAREKGNVLECVGTSLPSSPLAAALGGAGGLPALRDDDETAGDEGRGGWGGSFAMPAGGSDGVVHGRVESGHLKASSGARGSRKLGSGRGSRREVERRQRRRQRRLRRAGGLVAAAGAGSKASGSALSGSQRREGG